MIMLRKRGAACRRIQSPRLDPERLKPGSAGHGAFNPAAGGSSPPGSTSLPPKSRTTSINGRARDS
jgi:hypothetical protein